MKQSNILHTIYQTRTIGGVERLLESLLLNSNKEEKILTLYDESNNKLGLQNKIYSLREKNRSYNPLVLIYLTIKRAYLYKKYCRENNIDVCFSHGDSLNVSTISSKLLFKNKSKIVIFLHNSLSFYNNFGSGFYKFLFGYLYPKADKLVTISSEMRYELDSKGYTNTHTIYNPLDFENISKLKNKSLGEYQTLFENKKYTFITTGRFENVKNISFLISCFEKYHEGNKNSQFTIIGDGSLSSELRKEISHNENIHILPFQENVYKFLQAADCFLFSSFNEGFGRVLIESLACGTPVLTHDFKYGAKEIVRNSKSWEVCSKIEIHENGILTPYLDEQTFISAMGIMRQNSFDKNKIQDNIKKYSVENSIISYNQVIKNVSS